MCVLAQCTIPLFRTALAAVTGDAGRLNQKVREREAIAPSDEIVACSAIAAAMPPMYDVGCGRATPINIVRDELQVRGESSRGLPHLLHRRRHRASGGSYHDQRHSVRDCGEVACSRRVTGCEQSQRV